MGTNTLRRMNQTPDSVMQCINKPQSTKQLITPHIQQNQQLPNQTIPEQNSLTRGTNSHMIQKNNKSPTIPEQNRLTRGTITH